jgi:hypothetical protein
VTLLVAEHWQKIDHEGTMLSHKNVARALVLQKRVFV